MYAWLWHALPGPPPVRVALAVALLVAVVALLMLVVFPGVEYLLPATNVTTG